MSLKYCMQCGTPNEFDANFCKKCAYAFGTAVAKTTERQPNSSPSPKPVRRDSTRPNRASIILPQDRTQTTAKTITLPNQDIEDEDESQEGVSLNFVPELDTLEIEEIKTDEVKGVSFGQLVAEAQAKKAAENQGN
jgi:hypothetical protein